MGSLLQKAAKLTGKTLKIAAMIAGGIIALIIAFLALASLAPATPGDYMKKTETGGEIEKRYLKTGTLKVKYKEESAPEPLKKYELYYPAELPDTDGKYPLVLFLNGSGIGASKYKALFRHLASWGFIVAGNEDPATGTGASAERMLQYLLELNETPDSVFYGKIDADNIGISGHSQGGAGVLSALSAGEYSSLYKAAVALSPTNEETARALGWNYKLEKVSVPLLMFAGTVGDFETQIVLPFEAMTAMYDKVPGAKVMARRTGAEHGAMLYSADGYVTAWFMWLLQGDAEAAKSFTGDDAELFRNALYQDQKINMQ